MSQIKELEPRWPGDETIVELTLNRNSKAATRKYYFDYHKENDEALVFRDMKIYMPDTTAEESDMMSRKSAGREVVKNTRFKRVFDENGYLIAEINYGEKYE